MKKLLSLLTIAILSTTSISATTAFITNQNKKLINQNKILDSNVNKGKNFQKTTKNSLNFKQYNFSKIKFVNKNIIQQIGTKIYVGTFQNGLWISSDNGINFYQCKTIPSNWSINKIIPINYESKTIIYISSISYGETYEFYKSTDGLTFQQTFQNYNNTYKPLDILIENPTTIYIGLSSKNMLESNDGINFYQVPLYNITSIKKINNKIYFGGGYSGLYYTDLKVGGGFLSCNFPSKYSQYKEINTIQYINNKIYVGTNAGVCVANDGINFKAISNTGNYVSQIIKINNKIYVNSDSGLSISTTNDDTFQLSSTFTNNDINNIQMINNKVFIVSNKGLYSSNDGINFNKLTNIGIKENIEIDTITQINNKIYVGAKENGLYISETYDYNLYSKFFNKLDNPISEGIENNTFNLYYNQDQIINFKTNTDILNYQIDNENKTPNTDENITKNHTKITILFKDKNEAYNYPFGDANNGSVSFYINIINNDYFKNNSKLTYSTNSDINLYQGLIGSQGNINGEEIIATMNKNLSSSPAPLNINSYNIDYIDWSKSNYQKGTLDATGINFTKDTSSAVSLPQNGISNLANGVYQATITDLFGHSKKILWEIGSLNAKGQLDPSTNKTITDLATELNITESLTTTNDKIKTALLGKLNNYQTAISSYINTLNLNYEGFENSVDSISKKTLKETIAVYEKQMQKQFLENLNAINGEVMNPILFSTTTKKADQKTIVQAVNDFKIKKVANKTFAETIKSYLKSLIQKQIESGIFKNRTIWTKLKFNPSSWNFLTDPNAKQDLDKFNQYVIDYNNYINVNFNSWLQKDINNYGLGYLKTLDTANIKNKYTVAYFETQFLKTVNWTPNILSASKFDSNIDFTKFNTSVENYINTTFNVKGQLQTDILSQEKLSGISKEKINKIVVKYGENQLPKNKTEVETNYQNSKMSFSAWLKKYSPIYDKDTQKEQNSKTLKIILGVVFGTIGFVLILILVFWRRIKENLAIKRSKKQDKLVKGK